MISPINIKIFNLPGPLFFIALYSVVMGLIATAQQGIILSPLWSDLFNATNIGMLITILGSSISFAIAGIYAFRLSKKARLFYVINILLQIGVLILTLFLSTIEEAQEEIQIYLLSIAVSLLILLYVQRLIKDGSIQ